MFGVVGGDRRQIELASSLAADGYTVYACGFEEARLDRRLDSRLDSRVEQVPVAELAQKSEVVILPLPVTSDGIHLHAPFSEEPVLMGEGFASLFLGKTVYGGMTERLYRTSELWEEISVFDYFHREELAVRNAVPTAEGAIQIAMEEFPATINGSRCLVAGFGRIGKILAWMLRGLGAEVTVSARKPEDLAWIGQMGYRAVHTREPGGGYDLVFNTIPAMVFTRSVLSQIAPGTLLLDLASAPGGVDREAAEKLGIRVIPALSLPGKVAPKTAGEIIKETIYHMMEE